jgi:hypothetical protein
MPAGRAAAAGASGGSIWGKMKPQRRPGEGRA